MMQLSTLANMRAVRFGTALRHFGFFIEEIDNLKRRSVQKKYKNQ
jgi:hypothetical protein